MSPRAVLRCAAAALALAAASGARAQSVHQVREQLLADYDRMVADGMSPEEAWAKTRARGIELEHGSPRRKFVDSVMDGIAKDVGDGAIPLRDGQRPVARTGKEPTASRGQWSDEDFEAFHPRVVEQYRRQADRGKLRVRQDRLSLEIPEHDILVWKAPPKPPPTHQLGAAWDHALATATNHEFAPTAKPGAHARPMEVVLDNMNKGAPGLGKPPSQWGSSAEALERYTVTTKDVLRSFEQTGLCDSRPADCAWLKNRREMSTPPPATDAERRALFARDQNRLRSNLRDAFQSAERSLRDEARALGKALARPDLDPGRRLELHDEVRSLQDTMRRMFSRFDALHEQNPELVKYVSGSKERSRFLAGLQDEIQRLGRSAGGKGSAGESAADAEKNRQTARRMKAYTVVLTAAQLTQCLTEGHTAKQCAVQALEAAAQGLAESAGVMMLSLVTPTGAVVASAYFAIKGGVYTLVATTLAVREAALESFRLASALLEEHRAEQTLSAAQQANASRYQEQYARELAVFQQTAERIAAARRAQLGRLDVLEEAYTGLGRDLAAMRQALAAQEPRLAAARASYTALAERCHLLGVLEHRAGAVAEQAERADEERAGRVGEARAALAACASADALAEAERILAEDSRARADLAAAASDARKLREQVGASLPKLAAGVGQGPAPAGGGADLASEVALALEQILGHAQALESSRPYLEADFPAEVAALNGWIEGQRGELQTRLGAFEAAFPPELVAQEPGFAVLRMHIGAIEAVAPADWEARWKAARAQFPGGYPAAAFTSVEKAKALAAKFPRADVESCRSPLSEKLAQIDADLASAEARLAGVGERAGRDAAQLHLPRERCVARLGVAGRDGAPSGDADEIRRRRLSKIREGAQISHEGSDYHSPEARRARELEEQRRREEERRVQVLQAERERAWRESMESFGRGLEEGLGQPSSDLDPGPAPASPSRSTSVAETGSDRRAASACAPTLDFEACALMGNDAACGLGPNRGVYSDENYSCEQYCRCRVLEPR